MAVAAARALHLVQRPVCERRADAEREGIAHRDVELLPLTRPPPLAYRQEQRGEGGERPDRVAIAEARLRWRRVVQVAVEREEAARKLHRRAQGHRLALRGRLAEAGKRDVDQLRPDSLELLVAELELVFCSRPVIFDEDVRLSNKVEQELPSSWVYQIDAEAELAAVPFVEVLADVRPLLGRERPRLVSRVAVHIDDGAHRVPVGRRLDLDYLCPQVVQHHAQVGAGPVDRPVDDAQAGERETAGLPVH